MSYEVVITREGDDWLADVPAVPGAHTFARSLPSLFASVREVIVLMDDLDDDAEPDVTFRFEVADELVDAAVSVRKRRADLADLEARVQAETAKTVERLSRAGYSVRDAAALVGVTPGRISQMAPTKTRAADLGRKTAAAKKLAKSTRAKGEAMRKAAKAQAQKVK
ncbi:MAG: hypothetical protein QOK11_3996 [Pseudonocardiales bacterium]|jgi:predicted RNase H-like HicB family nuclease|nr:hypothetical protein [Pseudonocardiales bacterium]